MKKSPEYVAIIVLFLKTIENYGLVNVGCEEILCINGYNFFLAKNYSKL